MATPIRKPSIFDTPPGASDADAQAEKAKLGLVPIPGDEGTVAPDNTDPVTRAKQLRLSRVVTCQSNGRQLPNQKKLRTASVFTCATGDPICQRALFLNEGFIALGNDPTKEDVRGFTNQNTNDFNV